MARKNKFKNIHNDLTDIDNLKDFNYILSEYSQYLSIVLIYNEKCCNCLDIFKKLHKVRMDNNNNLLFFKININNNEEIVSELDLTSTPIIFFYKNTKMLNSIYATHDNIIEQINEGINNYL